MIGPAQCRAARGLLGWTQQDLADQAGLGRITIQNFEAGQTKPQRATRHVIQETFERAGVTFIDDKDDQGVKVRKA